FDFPEDTELWVPRTPATEGRTAHNWRVVGRLRDGVSYAAAQRDLSTVAQRIKQQYGDHTDTTGAAVRPVLEQLVGNIRPALLILFGAAGVLLLVACVNVANLLVARALARDRESALRLALGARTARLMRSFLAESLVLSLAGAALGLMVALAGVPALLALYPGRLPRAGNIGVDWPVLTFSLGISVLAALMIGLVPAIRAVRRDGREALADSHRIQGGSAASRRLRAALVAAQISLTFVLLAGAGLLGRSFSKLLEVDPGFRTRGATVMDLWFPEPCRYSSAGAVCNSATETRIVDFIERLHDRLRAIPGVERAGGVNDFPLEGGGADGTFVIVQHPGEISSFKDFDSFWHDPARTGHAEFRVASPTYFGTMRIPLIRGRFFDERDTRDSPHVAVISASLAKTRWPGENPRGKLIQFGNMDGDLRPFTIVGVVGDIHEYGIGMPPRPTFYVDYRQRPRTAFQFHIAIDTRGDPAAVIASARRIAQALDPTVPVAFEPLSTIVSASLADRQFILLLLSLFGGLALVLAATGVYGVTAYMAAQRTAEIGVRMALGARDGDVMRLLLRQGAAFAAVGIAIGLAAAFILTRVLRGFLYGVGAADPATFAAIVLVVFVITIAASGIPAYRASRIEAIEALRHS
ncbi:MAG TPA: ADOP family duplicated permease, partial [Gammaproteobacteria bacterium]|nr:ADOP family duplicated permease [Gammaproteobacteria bacterium]